ncbi:MAG: outer membrane protein assembly factor BamD [Candidatus Hydrogenedentes bacterium]|nr:outer membrane protein assembly factor BamD [Candidatus Hydrogenedentota bacterium]
MNFRTSLEGVRASGWLVVSWVSLLALAGCTTPRSTSPVTVTPHTKNYLLDERASEKEVEEARRMIETGDYTVVIPRLQHMISKYPESKAALQARYLLGVTYYKINGYRDAIDMFNEYLRLAPDGSYAKESKDYVARVTDEYNQKYPSPEKLDSRIDTLINKLRTAPDDLASQWELADLMWKRGDYQQSGRIYLHIIENHPEFTDDKTVASRIERLPTGEYVALTPGEVQRRQIREEPVEIINTSDFHSGEDLLTRRPRYYSVTGQAVNRGDSVLYGVQVMITLYGFGNVVYESTAVNIGRLNPGEIRAFSAQFSNFDNIENIARYECVSTFER